MNYSKTVAFDKKTVAILLLVPFCLSCNKYIGDLYFTLSLLETWGMESLHNSLSSRVLKSANPELCRLTYWVSVVFFFYFLLPGFLVIFIFREPLKSYGLKLKMQGKDFYVYLLMLAVMIPLVYLFSTTESFQSRYPFYTPRNGESLYPNTLIWELLYLAQFFGLEFFFRGFMVHGTKKAFGIYSIFVMTIPYCMIHFGKPFPETISSIAAGLALGYMSYKSGSILPGVVLHFCVGLGMDMAALYQKGFLMW